MAEASLSVPGTSYTPSSDSDGSPGPQEDPVRRKSAPIFPSRKISVFQRPRYNTFSGVSQEIADLAEHFRVQGDWLDGVVGKNGPVKQIGKPGGWLDKYLNFVNGDGVMMMLHFSVIVMMLRNRKLVECLGNLFRKS